MLKLVIQNTKSETKPREGQINILQSENSQSKESERYILELESSIRHIANALFELQDTDQLIGLISWYKRHVKLPVSHFPNKQLSVHDISAMVWLGPLTLQSQFRYEEAAKLYKEILIKFAKTFQNEKSMFIGLNHESTPLLEFSYETTRFISTKLIDCYIALSDWESAAAWIKEFESIITDVSDRKKIKNYNYSDYMKALMAFDASQFSETTAILQSIKKNRGGENDLFVDWCNPCDRLQRSEEMMIAALSEYETPSRLTEHEKSKRALSRLEPALYIIQDSLHVVGTMATLREAYPFLVQVQRIGALEQFMLSKSDQSLENKEENAKVSILLTPLESRSLHPTFHDIGLWNKTMRAKRYISKHSQKTSDSSEIQRNRLASEQDILVKLAKLSRKQGNLEFAHKLLEEALSIKIDEGDSLPFAAQVEESHLLYATKSRENEIKAIGQLWRLSRQYVSQGDKLNDVDKDLLVVCLLKFNLWMNLPNNSINDFGNLFSGVSLDDLTKQCFTDSVSLSSKSAPPWYRYAEWCYTQGQNKIKTITSITTTTSLPASAEEGFLCKILIPKEEEELRNLLKQFNIFKPDVIRKLRQKIFVKLTDIMSEESRDSSQPLGNFQDRNSEIVHLFETILKESDPTITVIPKEVSELFVTLWVNCRKRVLSYFEQAINNYFKYLSIGEDNFSDARKQAKGEMHGTKSALRVLRLMVMYGIDLEACLVPGFQTTPTISWCSIIPQLFSHLGHPDPWVRNQDKNFINRIGMDFPSVIVYPTVVGCENKNSNDIQNASQPQYQLIMDFFKSHSLLLVSEVQSMIYELTRIAVTWEEKSMIILRQAQNDVLNSRLRTIKDEINRLNVGADERDAVVQEIYSNIMKPVIVKLTRLINDTINTEPTTPYERRFGNQYGEQFQKALQNLTYPENYAELDHVFDPFKEIIKKITRSLKRQNHMMGSVSPRLLSLRSSCIPIPGLSLRHSVITIHSFEPIVTVISSKTKPKKILLKGSNGQKYTYLLKGREDLHLDERIMQFLSIVNQILNRDNECATRSLRARNYAVIPFSDTAGLIQWVEHATPLFSTYKRWQEQTIDNSSAQNTTPNDAPVKIPSPIDLFYSKMIPALKAKGINYMVRKEWPLEIVRKVFQDLMMETPNELLSRELWCSSTSLSQWWQITQAYARSTAVMSMVGYIIGLGDRHLDNILIDFNTGEVVHIDYNICFEKALKLLIPEIVPFRFTQNMVHALGANGIDGTFTIASENVLRVLRAQKETLITLLEAFVYDPLVDWTGNAKAQNEEFAVDLGVSLSLFSSRIDEIEQKYIANISELGELLPNSSLIFDEMLEYLREKNTLESTLESKRNQLENMRSNSTNAATMLTSTEVSLESSQHKIHHLLKLQSDYVQFANSAQQNCALNIQNQNKLIAILLQVSEIEKLRIVKCFHGQPFEIAIENYPSIPKYVSAIPNKMGLDLNILKACEDFDGKINTVLQKWEISRNSCIETLEKYNKVLLQLPIEDYVKTNIVSTWKMVWSIVLEIMQKIKLQNL